MPMQHFVRYQTTFIKLSIKSRIPIARVVVVVAVVAVVDGATQGPIRACIVSDS
jgi:hypothetical protein